MRDVPTECLCAARAEVRKYEEFGKELVGLDSGERGHSKGSLLVLDLSWEEMGRGRTRVLIRPSEREGKRRWGEYPLAILRSVFCFWDGLSSFVVVHVREAYMRKANSYSNQ